MYVWFLILVDKIHVLHPLYSRGLWLALPKERNLHWHGCEFVIGMQLPLFATTRILTKPFSKQALERGPKHAEVKTIQISGERALSSPEFEDFRIHHWHSIGVELWHCDFILPCSFCCSLCCAYLNRRMYRHCLWACCWAHHSEIGGDRPYASQPSTLILWSGHNHLGFHYTQPEAESFFSDNHPLSCVSPYSS